MHTPFRRPVVTLVTTTLAVLITGCGAADGSPQPAPVDNPPPVPAARAELAARAAAAKDLAAVSFYTFTGPDTDERTLMVVRIPDGSWRVDIPGGALSGTADIAMVSVDGQLFHCTLPDPPQPAACVAVEELTEDTDPQIHRVFTDWLDVLTDRAAAVSVATAAAPPDVSGACFSVELSAASLLAPLPAGIYCYDERGLLTGADLTLGTLRLVSTDPDVPDTISLPGPIIDGEPLPLEAPSPTPTPSPTAAD